MQTQEKGEKYKIKSSKIPPWKLEGEEQSNYKAVKERNK